MLIQKLKFTDFRNYKEKEFIFGGKTMLITGPNTVGKTNLLEGIYLMATGKSFKATLESEMINYDSQLARVKGRVMNDDKTDLEIILTKGELGGQKVARKKFLINGVSRRMLDFIGNLRAVYFRPEDLDMVIGSPSLRRKYLDFVLTQVDREYLRSLISYEKGLRQRNKLLEKIREEGVSRSQLLFWDQLLIKNGNYLTEIRQKFIDYVNQQKTELGYMIEYDKSVISPARLEEYAEEEVAAAATLVGPHRDDFTFKLNNRDLSSFGSRGEQRLGVLWLKLSELEYIAEQTHDRPVLLLDDIFSELDKEHRNLVLEIIPAQQTFITTTDLNFVDKKELKDMEVIEIDLK